ncbi:hypothetical protein AX14_014266 [Amanita brunnescens Koide BX004]|nr:hypothetical protein AX14_014266 [Amanita brunnescens Koide BX004]
MSSSEQSNKPTSASPEHTYPPVVAFAPQPFNGAAYPTPPPPGAYPPPFFAYPPPPDTNHAEGGPNGVPPPAPPYMMAFPPPPGMVYAFPPPPGQVPPGASPTPPALSRPKRKQVKMACTNCAAACKRCDEGRPCERCQKYGIGETCRDGQRKERKKGIKRGPYKRKNKNGESEWSPTAQASPANTTTTIHAVPQYASPEGFYGPIYYPTPGTLLPHPPHEVPPGQEGAPANGTPPFMPYFLPAYPPYAGPYGHPAMYPGPIPPTQQAQPPQPQAVQPQQTVQQAPSAVAKGPSAKKKKEEGSPANSVTEGTAASGPISAGAPKKRTRSSKGGEPKAKKAKTSRAAKEKESEAQKDGDVQAAST